MSATLTTKNFSKFQPAAMNLVSCPKRTQPSKENTTAPLTVLVADADPANLDLLSDLLEDDGFKVVIAHDGREAHKILQSNSDFTAAIFEVVIPHVSGPDLVRYMKRQTQLNDIPVIMMTRAGSAKLSCESLNAGAMVLLPEPFSSSQLHNLLYMVSHRTGPNDESVYS